MKIHSFRKIVIFIFIIIPSSLYSQSQIGQDIEGVASDDRCGWAVSLSGDGSILAIGVHKHDLVSYEDAGYVRVFQIKEGVWTQVGEDINGQKAFESFGHYVSISTDGSVVAVGASLGYGYGLVRIYKFDGSKWEQIGSDVVGETETDGFGRTLSLSSDGKIVAVGAYYNDGVNGEDSGHVRVYENKNDEWVQVGNDIDGEAAGDRFGYGVSLSSDGSIVAIGGHYNDGNGEKSGHVRIFENVNDEWVQVGNDIDGEAAGDGSGIAVDISADGNIVAIGAMNNQGVNGENSGHVRIYQFGDNDWIQLGEDIDGENEDDYSGYGVNISKDGSTVAIGAWFNSDNGIQSGHVRLYKFKNEGWTQIGLDIDGEAAGDRSGGGSLGLSDDGSIVAIGAPAHDGVNEENSGHVRVFKVEDILLELNDLVPHQLTIYPNPASDEIVIEFKGDDMLKKFQLYNQRGQLIKEKNTTTLNVSELRSGVYFLRIETVKGILTKKIVVK